MGITSIEWTDYSWNPWVGCTKISAACDHCYAESWAKRAGSPELWAGSRRRTTPANWRQPIKWNRDAEASGVRRKVFCASLADVFDNQVPEEWRIDLFAMIEATPWLDWLLLTKRPQNIKKLMPAFSVPVWDDGARDWRDAAAYRSNVWLGTTVENQDEMAKRRGHLLSVPAAVHFLSCEPLLERVWLPAPDSYWHSLDWVICGGESGGHARIMEQRWARSLRDQCAEMDIAFFMKQVGTNRTGWPQGITGKGDNILEWPEDLRIREFPRRTYNKT